MATKIRLARLGGKKKPYYRLVVADSKAKRDGRFLDVVGSYDPLKTPFALTVDRARLDGWVGKGAVASPTVSSLLKRDAKGEA
ncbi:MAG: 30S ribosomal protein S16 [Deltaproteobacteria bacterium]|jgi:small subunit ribosomal protein S16|nr:30S ribosomal protein S16 [Deltaproteobacteria bacterium]